MSAGGERIVRSLMRGVFGMLFAVALTAILIAFLALRNADYSWLISLVIVALLGFALGFWRDWRRPN